MKDALGQFVEKHVIERLDELNRLRHLPDAVAFIEFKHDLITWSDLFNLPPHSDFHFQAQNFDLGVIEDRKLNEEVLGQLMNQRQMIVSSYTQAEFVAEKAFTNYSYPAVRPLLISFASAIDLGFFPCPEFQGDILHVGLQRHLCARQAIDSATKSGARLIFLDEIHEQPLLPAIEKSTRLSHTRPAWMRLDLSALAWAQTGLACSSAEGISMRALVQFLERIPRLLDLKGVSIGPAETMAPTSIATRSVAQILSTLIHEHSHRRILSGAHGKIETDLR